MAELGQLRSLIGRSAAVWAGRVEVEDDRWVALSGANAVDYNVAVCHGAGSATAGRDAILAGRAPGLVMLAGRALAEAQLLVESRWACVDAVPIMSLALAGTDADPVPAEGFEERRLGGDDIDAAQAVIASSFGIPVELGAVALPARSFDDPKVAVWGAFDAGGALLSTLILVRVEDAVVPWSMATLAAARGTGRGKRLLIAALAEARDDGASLALLQSSPTAIGFYRSCGFTELETWQIWSRPRWVLGRA